MSLRRSPGCACCGSGCDNCPGDSPAGADVQRVEISGVAEMDGGPIYGGFSRGNQCADWSASFNGTHDLSLTTTGQTCCIWRKNVDAPRTFYQYAEFPFAGYGGLCTDIGQGNPPGFVNLFTLYIGATPCDWDEDSSTEGWPAPDSLAAQGVSTARLTLYCRVPASAFPQPLFHPAAQESWVVWEVAFSEVAEPFSCDVTGSDLTMSLLRYQLAVYDPRFETGQPKVWRYEADINAGPSEFEGGFADYDWTAATVTLKVTP